MKMILEALVGFIILLACIADYLTLLGIAFIAYIFDIVEAKKWTRKK